MAHIRAALACQVKATTAELLLLTAREVVVGVLLLEQPEPVAPRAALAVRGTPHQ